MGNEEELASRYFQEAYEQQILGKLDEAVILYKKSLEMHPTAEAFTFLGWTYCFMGKLDDAIAECEKAIEIDPDFGNPYNDIGAYLIEKGKPDEAVPWLEKATRAARYESYAYPHFNLGRVYEIKGDWARALECYRHALDENPGYVLAKNAIAKIQSFMN